MENAAIEEHSQFFAKTRKWMPNVSISQENGQSIRIMSYNLLADCYISYVDYSSTNSEYLKWNYRRKLIINEINSLSPDILFVQELQDARFIEYLNQENYCSLCIQKTQDRKDGSAVFWKSSSFECIGTWKIDLGKPEVISYLYDKPQVACFAALKVGQDSGKQIIIVGTTHILYSKELGDIKLAQLNLITQCLSKIKNYVMAGFPDYSISIVFGGDFNSSPNSGIYQYMSEGYYDFKSQNRDQISGQMYNNEATENAFLESIRKIKPNENADPFNLYQSFAEITNTEVYLKSNKRKGKHFKFGFKTNYDIASQLSAEIERIFTRIQQEKPFKQMLQCYEDDQEIEEDIESILIEEEEQELEHNYTQDTDHNELILENPLGSFKSAYSQAMSNFKELLFCNESNSEYIQLLNRSNADYSAPLRSLHTENDDLIYGAFKPNISNIQEFESYWEGTNMEPAYSINTDKTILVDYIWYQSKSMKVIKVLDVPNVFTELSKFKICPNKLIPSDHIPIVVDFLLE